MSEISKNIVSLIVSKEFHKAKTLIHEAMNNKLGILLEEKLLEYAPTLYERTDEPPQLSVSREVDLDSPVDNITLSGSDATHSDSINVSHGPGIKWSNGPAARAMRIRSGLGQSVPWTQDQIDQITGIPRPDAKSPVADRVYDTGVAAGIVAQDAWLAKTFGFFSSGGLAPVRPWVGPQMIDKAIYPAAVAGQVLMTAGNIAKHPGWKGNEGDKLKAFGDAAKDTARAGMRVLALRNPWTGIPSLIDQQLNDGRATDAVTDALIDGPQDWLDSHSFPWVDRTGDPVAVKNYNKTVWGSIFPDHRDFRNDREIADDIMANIKTKRDTKRDMLQGVEFSKSWNQEFRRRANFEQANVARDVLDQIGKPGKPGKPPVAAGTVREGSGRIMYQ